MASSRRTHSRKNANSALSRKNNTDARISSATLELLRSGGAPAVSVEAVSARSGVAKTTIYRRYADRLELLEAVLDNVVPTMESSAVTAADAPRAELLALLRSVCDLIQHRVGISVISAIFDTPRDAGAEVILNRIINLRVDNMAEWVSRWQAAGRLRTDLDPELAVITIFGTVALTYARRGEFPSGWPEAMVEHLWPMLGVDDGHRGHD